MIWRKRNLQNGHIWLFLSTIPIRQMYERVNRSIANCLPLTKNQPPLSNFDGLCLHLKNKNKFHWQHHMAAYNIDFNFKIS